MLVMLAYWLAIYTVIVLEEHYIFRRGSFKFGYDLDAYNTLSKLPRGYAAIAALCCGIAGAVLGMSQRWYIGVIAAKIGTGFGADIGFELSASFAGV